MRELEFNSALRSEERERSSPGHGTRAVDVAGHHGPVAAALASRGLGSSVHWGEQVTYLLGRVFFGEKGVALISRNLSEAEVSHFLKSRKMAGIVIGDGRRYHRFISL